MAISTPYLPCPICGRALDETIGVIGFPDLLPMFDEFAEFYDAAAQSECMRTWHRRDEFVAYFNAQAVAQNVAHVWKLVVDWDGQVVYERR